MTTYYIINKKSGEIIGSTSDKDIELKKGTYLAEGGVIPTPESARMQTLDYDLKIKHEDKLAHTAPSLDSKEAYNWETKYVDPMLEHRRR